MVVIVFMSRVRPENAERYYQLADDMEKIARTMSGFISYKGYFADDGERVSIHEWETPEHLKAWREHPEHKHVQALGRQDFYEEFTSYVCDNPRTSQFQRARGV
ncbi:MAG: antibiotic biosynthesis monooxygenase [Rhodospirillales bacterium]|nr:antibiotic biosynthesis monooxygenase [Rhodospirillales bacterium]